MNNAYPNEPPADDVFSQKAYQNFRDMTIGVFGDRLNDLTAKERTALANKFSWMILPLEESVEWNKEGAKMGWAGASKEKADDMEKKRELLQMKLDAVKKRINAGHNKWNSLSYDDRRSWDRLIERDEVLRKTQDGNSQGGKRRSKSSNKPKKSAKRVKTAKRSKSRKIRRQRK